MGRSHISKQKTHCKYFYIEPKKESPQSAVESDVMQIAEITEPVVIGMGCFTRLETASKSDKCGHEKEETNSSAMQLTCRAITPFSEEKIAE